MALCDSTLRERPADHVQVEWRISGTDPTVREYFRVSQYECGAVIRLEVIKFIPRAPTPEDPDPTDDVQVDHILTLTEVEASKIGVILTLFTDAELCIADREETLRGSEGPRILARSIARQARKSAATAPAPNEPASPPGEPVSEQATFSAGASLTTALGAKRSL